MLVLSRKVGERILIGDQISVTVVRINGNAVRIGINAPSELPVIRDELKERMEAAERGADCEVAESAERAAGEKEAAEIDSVEPCQESPSA